jgi:toxin YoeB
MYIIDFVPEAAKDVIRLRKSDAQAYKKLQKLIEELKEHPTTGTGQIEQLKGNYSGYWSRRITKQYRLIYTIHEDIVTVEIVSVGSHYGDK